MALGNQDLKDTTIIGAVVSGIATTSGSEIHFVDCEMNDCTLGASHLQGCGLTGTIILGSATTYTLQTCHSEIAGSATPTIDFDAAIGNSSLNMRRYSGGIEIKNMGATGTDTMSLEGNGALIINANCVGGSIVLRGDFSVTGAVAFISAGGTITYDDNTADIKAIAVDTGTTLPALIDDLAIKKNATFSNFEFLMVLTSDHVTPATGLTVTGERSIDGAAFAAVAGAIAEVSNGIYQFDALAADTNGDVITWRFSSATADDTFVTFKTVA